MRSSSQASFNQVDETIQTENAGAFEHVGNSTEPELVPFERDSEESAVEICIPSPHLSSGKESVQHMIKRFTIRNRWTRQSVEDVICLAKTLGADIPTTDARTLLGICRTPIDNKEFQHFGLIEGLGYKLRHGLKDNGETIHLQAHIDGISIYRKSKRGLWPITVRVVNCNDDAPFVVSCYCGEGKPNDLFSFLGDFLDELVDLQRKGATVFGKYFNVKCKAVILDAQARSLVKCVAGCGSKKGCERCCVIGRKVLGRMTFKSVDCKLRSDHSFRTQEDFKHQKGGSPFLRTDLDMIFSFPLDGMHLIYLGVVKRILDILNGDPNMGYKRKINGDSRKKLAYNFCYLDREERNKFNQLILHLRHYLPKEFNRKGDTLDKLSNWKATEYRLFLLYTGPVILKEVLSEEFYNHFLYLHGAITILASPNIFRLSEDKKNKWIDFANQCLKYYVQKFGDLFGEHHLVYNVHSLIHLAEDCKIHGDIESFSAFVFESYLGFLKSQLGGKRRELSELRNKIHILHSFSEPKPKKCSAFKVEGIIPGSKKDCYCRIKKGVVIKINSVNGDNVFGQQFVISNVNNEANFYEKPFKSSVFGIYQSTSVGEEQIWNINEFEGASKCVVFKLNGNFVIFPLLHVKKF